MTQSKLWILIVVLLASRVNYGMAPKPLCTLPPEEFNALMEQTAKAMKVDEYKAICEAAGVEYVGFEVYDGEYVFVNDKKYKTTLMIKATEFKVNHIQKLIEAKQKAFDESYWKERYICAITRVEYLGIERRMVKFREPIYPKMEFRLPVEGFSERKILAHINNVMVDLLRPGIEKHREEARQMRMMNGVGAILKAS